MTIDPEDPLAVAVAEAIRGGDLEELRRLLAAHPAGWSSGGQRRCAEYLLDRGAKLDWVPPWEPLTPLDAAAPSGADDPAAWLRAQGARSAGQGLA